MADIGIKELLEAGVHFGHQTRRWNPKMRRFIFGERDGIYIIDLLQTEALLENARRFAADLSRRGGTVLFVGTKKQARDAIKEIADSAEMPYVNHRWLGGLLTNFQTISLRIRRLHDLERYETEGQLQLLPTRERMAAQADLEKLRANLGGVKNMQRVPDAVFVIDLKTEAIAVREAQRLRIPIIGLVDTNCDPDGIEFVIPGNDDAIRSCAAITRAIGDVVAQGHGVFRAEEERARLERERQEAEERARREAEEQARREAEERARAEEQARREAEQQAARDAEQQAAAAAAAAEAATASEAAPTPAAPQAGAEAAQTAPPAADSAPAEAPTPAAPQAGAAAQPAPAEAPAPAETPAPAPAETPAPAPAETPAPAEAPAQTQAPAEPAGAEAAPEPPAAPPEPELAAPEPPSTPEAPAAAAASTEGPGAEAAGAEAASAEDPAATGDSEGQS
ncbi:MAG TPA: 30S ribosomal protein S2 [Solirubrobacteraceae bacterium]